jgi:hypothetical protein
MTSRWRASFVFVRSLPTGSSRLSRRSCWRPSVIPSRFPRVAEGDIEHRHRRNDARLYVPPEPRRLTSPVITHGTRSRTCLSVARRPLRELGAVAGRDGQDVGGLFDFEAVPAVAGHDGRLAGEESDDVVGRTRLVGADV